MRPRGVDPRERPRGFLPPVVFDFIARDGARGTSTRPPADGFVGAAAHRSIAALASSAAATASAANARRLASEASIAGAAASRTSPAIAASRAAREASRVPGDEPRRRPPLAASALARVEGANDASGRSSPSSSSSGESSDTLAAAAENHRLFPRGYLLRLREGVPGWVSARRRRCINLLDPHRPRRLRAASATRRNTRSSADSSGRPGPSREPPSPAARSRRTRADERGSRPRTRAHRAQARLENAGAVGVAGRGGGETPSQRVRDVVEVGLQKTPDGVDGGGAFVRRLSKGGRVVVSRRPLGVRLGERLRGPLAQSRDARRRALPSFSSRGHSVAGTTANPAPGRAGPRTPRIPPRPRPGATPALRRRADRRRREASSVSRERVRVRVRVRVRFRPGARRRRRDRPERRGEVLVQHETRRAARRVPGRSERSTSTRVRRRRAPPRVEPPRAAPPPPRRRRRRRSVR